jgi:FkbM family methyltransferase
MDRIMDTVRETGVLDAARRSGLAAVGRPFVYLARDAYCHARAAPKGWRHRTVVAGVEASFPTTNWFEYRRARELGGERALIESLLAELDGDEVVWDVGATVGTYACFLAQSLPGGEVVGFEPQPDNLSRLRANLAANAPGGNWAVRGVALSDRDGTTRLASTHRPADVGAPGTGHYYLDDEAGVEVTCRRADSLIRDGVPEPDVLKVDVQGAEGRVLDGFGARLADVGTVLAELHTEKCQRYGTTVEAVEDRLSGAGFSLSPLGEPDHFRTGVYHVLATR